MNLIAVLIDEDGDILGAYGPFLSSEALREWANNELLKIDRLEWWRYEEVRLMGVTEDKG